MTEWSGRTSAYAHKRDDWRKQDISKTPAGVRKVWLLDAQWSTCPVEVEDQVKALWRHRELGNDRFMIKTNIKGLQETEASGETINDTDYVDGKLEYVEVPVKTDLIVKYLLEMGVQDGDEVIIHWWW